MEWPGVFRDRIAAFREVQQRELDNAQDCYQAIKETPPEFREEPRAAYEESLAKLQEAQRQESLWWLGRPKMPGLSLSEVREVVETVLNQKGYWNIGVVNTKNRKVTVTFEDGEGNHTQAGIPFSKAEKWAESLSYAADIPPERMEAFAAAMGKQIVEGENGETYTVDIETGEIEEPAEEEQEPEPVQAKVISNGGKLMQENYGQGRVEVGPEDMAEWVRQQQEQKEAKVEEKELPPLEKAVEIPVVNPSILSLLKLSEQEGKTLLITYQNKNGEINARLVKVLMVDEEEGRFNVCDGKSYEVREGWFVASVLQAYESIKPLKGGFAKKLKYYGKKGYTVAMTPCAAPYSKARTSRWATPEQAEKLLSTGNWKRLS